MSVGQVIDGDEATGFGRARLTAFVCRTTIISFISHLYLSSPHTGIITICMLSVILGLEHNKDNHSRTHQKTHEHKVS